MSIFKTEANSEMVTATDSVVSATICKQDPRLPGFKKTDEMDVMNISKGAVRRTSGEKQ